MGIPTLDQKMIKRQERNFCKPIEADTEESCEKALTLEKASSKTDANYTTKINVQYDLRWGKRGRAMNSKTGFESLVGKETGKVVAFGTRNTSCRTCSIAERKEKRS